MRTGVDVPVLGGDHQVVVLPAGGHVGGDPFGDGIAAGDRQGAALAEGGLDVDDDEGPAGAGSRAGVLLAHSPTIARWRAKRFSGARMSAPCEVY